jgi:hypothetical protein
LVGKPERKRPLGRPGTRWKVFKINFQEIWWDCVGWIHLAQQKKR